MIAIIPAHDEEELIGDAIGSLRTQTRPVDRIIVVADNCTDKTVDVAQSLGVDVVSTVGNTHKKAGALNQVLDDLLPALSPQSRVLVMDADSTLSQGFVQAADERLAVGDVSACGGVFTGKPGGGFVGMLQRNEYARYARDIARIRGRVLVLTGTAAVFLAGVLTEVIAARRSHRLPGEPHVYDTRVLTEDNELTLALLHLGHRIVSPPRCRLTTEVMPTWRQLWSQRLRWKRGAVENLRDYGWTPVTRAYWGRQLLSLVGIIVTLTYLGTVLISLLVTHTVHVYPIWLAVTAVFVIERVVTVRRRGVAQMVVAAMLVVEMVFDVFLQVCQGKAFIDSVFGTERKW